MQFKALKIINAIEDFNPTTGRPDIFGEFSVAQKMVEIIDQRFN